MAGYLDLISFDSDLQIRCHGNQLFDIIAADIDQRFMVRPFPAYGVGSMYIRNDHDLILCYIQNVAVPGTDRKMFIRLKRKGQAALACFEFS